MGNLRRLVALSNENDPWGKQFCRDIFTVRWRCWITPAFVVGAAWGLVVSTFFLEFLKGIEIYTPHMEMNRWSWYLPVNFYAEGSTVAVFLVLSNSMQIWVNCSGYYTQYTYLRYRRRLWLTHLCLLLDTLEPHTYMLYSQRVVAIQSSTKLLSLQLNGILLRVLLIPCRNAQILRPHPRWASRLGAFLFNCFLSNYSPFRLCVVEFPC